MERAWASQVLPELPISVRSKWRGGQWVEAVAGGPVRFAVDNAWHQKACEGGRLDVEKVLTSQFGGPMRIEIVVVGDSRTSGGGASMPTGPEPDEAVADMGDVSQLADANDVATGGVDLLLREFGGELVEEDPL